MPEDVVEQIKTEASVANTNTNTLVKQIFEHHLGFEGNAGKVGLISFPKQLLIKLMEKYTEKQIIEMAQEVAKNNVPDIMAILQNEFTTKAFLTMIKSWARASNIPFKHEVKGALNTCVMEINMSRIGLCIWGTFSKASLKS